MRAGALTSQDPARALRARAVCTAAPVACGKGGRHGICRALCASSAQGTSAAARHREFVRRDGCRRHPRAGDPLSVILSSAAEQAKYGGVVPEVASRAHTDAISEAVRRALDEAGTPRESLDAVAVTYGAGTSGRTSRRDCPLRSPCLGAGHPADRGRSHPRPHGGGISGRSRPWSRPLSPFLQAADTPPCCTRRATPISRSWVPRATTPRGEAFDKAARVLGLPYPGGPNIEKLAREGEPNIPFPKMFRGAGYDFSYSGLKTAVINYCHNKEQKGEPYSRADVAASFQQAACGALVERAVAAAKSAAARHRGGRRRHRQRLAAGTPRGRLPKRRPARRPSRKKFCTDNAAMIASEGLVQYRAGNFADLSVNACAISPSAKRENSNSARAIGVGAPVRARPPFPNAWHLLLGL